MSGRDDNVKYQDKIQLKAICLSKVSKYHLVKPDFQSIFHYDIHLQSNVFNL